MEKTPCFLCRPLPKLPEQIQGVLDDTLKLVNDLQICPEEANVRVKKRIGEAYIPVIEKMIRDTTPPTHRVSNMPC